MKKIFLPISTVFLLFISVALPGQTVQKTLVRTFDVGNKQELLLDLGGPVTVQTWSSDMVRIQMQIVLSNVHENLLQNLVYSGRYNLKGDSEGTSFAISSPGMRKTVRIGDAPLAERVAFTVFVPENTTVTISGVKIEDIAADGTVSLKPM